jgi:hypothetical protein
MNNENNEDEDRDFVNITEDMLDPASPELTYREEDDDIEDEVIPTSIKQKFSGIPRSIRSLATFSNPNPQDKWENIMG